MKAFTPLLRTVCCCLAVVFSLYAMSCQRIREVATISATPAYPAGQGFDLAGSDARAIAIADTVMARMGGFQNWQNTRYLAWSFFRGQYQIWDKYTGDFHWEQDSLVANYNLLTRTGKAYKGGREITDTPGGQELLEKMYPLWVNNSWWLIMPFKLKDSGITLNYRGLGTTFENEPADILQMTFKDVGVTPENRYEIRVLRNSGLVQEWSYFAKAADPQPAFRRRWSDYAQHGNILLASDRSDPTKPARIADIAVRQTVPAGLMDSPVPVQKLQSQP
ncbi:hypothetical protein [Hymenobacter roseosalivarius]|nr:hypothetical protein [Hymenobacter roseosalivarius]